MAAKMDVITFTATGHVMAADVRQDTGGGSPDAATLVGTGLLLRDPFTGDTRITLPPDRLSVTSIDLREDVLMTAQRFAIVDGLPEVPAGNGLPAVALAGGQVRVTLPGGDLAADDLETWVYIDGGVQPVVQQVGIAKAANSGAEPLSLTAGNYRALVLVPGYLMAIQDVVAAP
ncbi:MAG TPA: hypothetical protein VMT54_03830 [Candidatus Cybelea sp.]|nr:hypothetical protein [Candidatus Cybelea sp.]